MKHQSFFTQGNFHRIGLLILFTLVANFVHNAFSNFELEFISGLLLISIFGGILIFEYISLFQKNLPKKEYFINIFFIIFFTIFLFATIYAEDMSGNNFFRENGEKVDLNFMDALYFSTITLTTVGYGDIVPVGVFRFFVIIEIFMGLAYTGTLVYILTKHLDGDK